MPVKNSLIAIGAFSIFCCLLQGMTPSEPAAPVRPAAPQARKARPTPLPVKIPFGPPTQNVVSRQLRSGTVHVYPLPLKAGERVVVIAFQDGVDLQAALFDPAGQHLFTVNSPNGTKGAERIFWVAKTSGNYRIEISCSEQKAVGDYRISINDQGPANEKDQQDALAEQLFYRAAEEMKARALDRVEEKLQNAARLWEEINNQRRQADALNALGGLYRDAGRFDEALQKFSRIRNLYHRLGRIADEGLVDNSIGAIQAARQDLVSAQNSFNQALACGESGNDRSVIAAAYENLGTLFRSEGHAEEALASLEKAREIWKGLNVGKEAGTLVSMGELFVAEGEWNLANEKYQEAWAVLTFDRDPGAKAQVLQGLGNLYLKTHQPEQALRHFRKALDIQQQARLLNDLPNSLNGIADALLNEKQPLQALTISRQALTIYEQRADLTGQARVLVNIGWALARLHRYTESRDSYERALTLNKSLDPWTVAAARLGLALLEKDRRNPISAQREAEAAVKSVEGLRGSAGSDFRMAFSATKRDSYDALIDILLWRHSLSPAAGYDAQALRVSEQARSRGLLDRVSAVAATANLKSSPSSPPILSLREIQSHLDSETLLLEYHLGRRASWLWVVGASFCRVFRLPPREQLENLINRVAKLLPNSQRRERFLEARRAATELSHTLLGPKVVPRLGHKRLLISAPDALQSANLGTLPDPGIAEPPLGDRNWPQPLLVDHEVDSILSASLASALHAREAARPRPQDRLAVIGDPVSDDHDKRLAGSEGFSPSERKNKDDARSPSRFPRLESAEAEGKAILKEAGQQGVTGAFGFDATRELVLSGQLSTFGNLHFVTHGFVEPGNAKSSFLVLSQWDRQGHSIDGLLTADDISHLDLPADLVVLSACETGLGERIPGEGIVGLSHAFMEAGATRVMVSLWKVEDQATSKLMDSFYHEYFTNGLSPLQALRRAQTAMWKSQSFNAPFFWGGFEVQGDWQWVRDPR
jgi:tetratricopeptide (TPR) repeat protein